MSGVNGEGVVEKRGPGHYRTSHDMTSPGLSVTITQALAEVDGIDTVETVQNFSRYVDPDALDRLFRIPRNREHRHQEGFVHLEIEGIKVTVHADGEIDIEP